MTLCVLNAFGFGYAGPDLNNSQSVNVIRIYVFSAIYLNSARMILAGEKIVHSTWGGGANFRAAK